MRTPLLIAAIAAAHLIYATPNACAQTGTSTLGTMPGALIFEQDSAALVMNGQRFSLTVKGVQISPAGTTATPFVAIVYNLRSPIDIVGTYVAASPTDPADRDPKATILLQNENGVVLRFDVKEHHSEFSPGGLTIRMQ